MTASQRAFTEEDYKSEWEAGSIREREYAVNQKQVEESSGQEHRSGGSSREAAQAGDSNWPISTEERGREETSQETVTKYTWPPEFKSFVYEKPEVVFSFSPKSDIAPSCE